MKSHEVISQEIQEFQKSGSQKKRQKVKEKTKGQRKIQESDKKSKSLRKSQSHYKSQKVRGKVKKSLNKVKK